jgi:hypothetical protein
VACMMGANFSFVTINEKFTPRVVENVDRYGLRHRFAGASRMQVERITDLVLLCHFLIHRALLLQTAWTPGQGSDQPDGELPADGGNRVRHVPLRPHWRHPAAGNLRVAQVFQSACGGTVAEGGKGSARR